MKEFFGALSNPFDEPPKRALESGVRPKKETERPLESREDRLVSETRNLDLQLTRLLVQQLSKRETERFLEEQVHVDALREGEQLTSERIGEVTHNTVSMRSFEYITDDEYFVVKAYAKPSLGEAVFLMIDGVAHEMVMNDEGELEPVAVDMTSTRGKDHAKSIDYQIHRRPALKKRLAIQYGVSQQELGLSDTTIAGREGIGLGVSTRSEYTVAHIARIVRFDEYPATALRSEKDDVLSVQESVEGRKPSPEFLHESIEWDGSDPRVQSLMRVACMDYLMVNLDRHIGNILFDKKANKFRAIDNGFSLGLSEVAEPNLDPETPDLPEGQNRPVNTRWRSVPMELVEQREDWLLDDDAWTRIQSLDEQLSVEYSAEHQHFLQLFQFQYRNETIARYELNQFKLRLAYLAEHGRPPKMRGPYLEPNFKPLG